MRHFLLYLLVFAQFVTQRATPACLTTASCCAFLPSCSNNHCPQSCSTAGGSVCLAGKKPTHQVLHRASAQATHAPLDPAHAPVADDGFEVLALTSPEAVSQFFLCCKDAGVLPAELLLQPRKPQRPVLLVGAVGEATARRFTAQLLGDAVSAYDARDRLGRQASVAAQATKEQPERHEELKSPPLLLQPPLSEQQADDDDAAPTAASAATKALLEQSLLLVSSNASGVALAQQLRERVAKEAATTNVAATAATFAAAGEDVAAWQSVEPPRCSRCHRPARRVLWPASALADSRFACALTGASSSSSSCSSQDTNHPVCWWIRRFNIYTMAPSALSPAQRNSLLSLIGSRCLASEESNSDTLNGCGIAVMLGSPSAVSSWVATNRLPRRCCHGNRSDSTCDCLVAVCIGETTAAAARAAGFSRVVCPRTPGLTDWLRCLYTAMAARHRTRRESAKGGAHAARAKKPLVIVTRPEAQASELLQLLAKGVSTHAAETPRGSLPELSAVIAPGVLHAATAAKFK
ncbi:hypothetical protein cyc_00454 [Cyclospora cayetanensis]|uniref:Uroporphyrinogen-III synthase n=1 Tax=Cyclospora cayetanensis TaxID=88456 RepID=A0A1D3CUT7_9EIME|nr:hypothetical protein cyc_00454 [Cyclospora cayetanensis]